MPFIAVLAVALCVTLVIVVVSVMSGFLDMLKDSGRTLVGDVVLSKEVTGIPYYRELIEEIEKLPEAEAASPVIETFGLLQMPYGPDSDRNVKSIEMVQVWGIEPATLSRVIDFQKTVYWKTPDQQTAETLAKDDPRLDPSYNRLQEAMAMRGTGAPALPGIMLGIEMSLFNERQRDGSYRTSRFGSGTQERAYWMPLQNVSLTVVPVSESGDIDFQQKRAFSIVNEFQTGVYQIDANRVLIGLDTAQDMLRLSESVLLDTTNLDENEMPRRIGVSPARATTILVKAKPEYSPIELRNAIEGLYERFAMEKSTEEGAVEMPYPVSVRTWEQRLKDLIGPVEKERALMRVLFSLVYVVCAGLVLAIFWSIVHEKTRDIGILRSVGAGRTGILTIFLAYGLTIGVVGSAAGLGLAWLVVDNINEIHTAMGEPAPRWAWMVAAAFAAASATGALVAGMRGSVLHTLLWSIIGLVIAGIAALLYYHVGVTIWDPSVYYFSTIPNKIDMTNAYQTMAFATIFSVFGAAIPAAKAADTDPVRSLRYE